MDITSNLELTSTQDNEINFSFTARNIRAHDLNQFSIKVYNNHKNKELLSRLAQIKAKIDRRILALHDLKNKSKKDNWSEKALEYINKKTEVLNQLSQQIAQNINSNESLLAENRYAIQVDNLIASSSQISTILNKYRFLITSEVGTVIEGLTTKIKGVVTNLRHAGNDNEDKGHEDEDKNRIAKFEFNGVNIFTSEAQKLANGKSIVYEYVTPQLLPINANEFKISLYNYEESQIKKQKGGLALSVPVAPDTEPPQWLSESVPTNSTGTLYFQALNFVNLNVSDSFGRIDENSFSAKLVGSLVNGSSYNQDVTNKLSHVKIGDGWGYSFVGDLNPLEEGEYSFEASVKDFAKNSAPPDPYEVNFRIDRTKPIISVNLQEPILTNKTNFDISIIVSDLSPAKTDVYVNNELSFTTTLKLFTAVVALNIEGNNLIKVVSTDAAGNVSEVRQVTIIRDTTPPVLSQLSPANNSKVFSFQFPISGVANEILSVASIDGLSLDLSVDKTFFSGSYLSARQGLQILILELTDVAGNKTVSNINIDIQAKLLNPELISVFADVDSKHVFIKGNVGATRGGAEVTASAGILSFNSDTQTSNSDGSFLIRLDIFSSVTVTARDLQIGETDSTTISFKPVTTLSGLVKDTDGIPLPGATISIQGTNVSSITDGQGLFSIATEVTGDHLLLIDGSTISQAVKGLHRDFSKTNIAINIGLGQTNVLERPIFLAPLYLDGSETSVVTGQPTMVTSGRAPGVALNVPANSTKFPDGSAIGDINIATIDSRAATIAVPSTAIPDTVVALEPSGLSFSKRVPLILPNENGFKPGVRLLIYSMNSTKGIWEIDGEAQVSDNGSSIETLPNKGISHFSLVYAVPMKPLITEVSNPNQIGVDVSQGSLTTNIELPAFKSLSQSIAPKLTYKSNWANPTAYVSNLFDIPTYEEVITYSSSQVAEQKQKYRLCPIKIGNWNPSFFCRTREYLTKVQFDTNIDGTSSYVPESIRAQLFVSNLSSSQAIITNEETSGNNNIATLPGAHFNNSKQSEIVAMQGIPSRSLLTFSMPLRDAESGQYLKTGLYPTLTRYEIRLKHMVLYTKTTTETITTYRTDNGIEVVNPPKTEIKQTTHDESRVLEAMAPQDVLSDIAVVNKVNSEFGRGWNFSLAQKIINPESNRILIEEPGGDISTYAINNTISTLYNGSNSALDFDSAIDLSQWPKAYSGNKDSQKNSYLTEIDLPSNSSNNINQLPVFSGLLASQGYNQCVQSTACDSGGCYTKYMPSVGINFGGFVSETYNYKTTFRMGGLLKGLGNEFFILDKSQHSFYANQYGNLTKLMGQTMSVDDQFALTISYPRGEETYKTYLSASRTDINTICNTAFGNECGPIISQSSPHNCDDLNIIRTCPSQNTGSGTIQKITSFFCTVTRHPKFLFAPSVGEIGKSGADLAGLNTPAALATNGSEFIYIADKGNNRVISFNTNTNEAKLVAGNSTNFTSGNGIQAVNAGLFHPQGLAFDITGNLYIATEDGYIKKVDTTGIITNFAGLPINLGGVLTDEIMASQMTFANPSSMVIDNDNQLMYVADTGNNRVVKIDMATKMAVTVAGNRTCDLVNIGDNQSAINSSLCAPTAVGLDNNHNLIVVDSGHKRIRRVIFNSKSNGILAYSPTSKDLSTLLRNNDGTWSRTYRDGTVVHFNIQGLQLSSEDRVGHKILFSYDAQDHLYQIQDAAGQLSTLEYVGRKLSKFRDPANRITLFNYSGDFLTSINLPDGTSKSFEYDINGQMTKETNQRGKSNGYVYNDYNRLAKVIDANLNEIQVTDMATQSMTNNYVGGNTGELLSAGIGSSKIHDRIVDAKSVATEIARDFNGFITLIKDGTGRITRINRDEEGLPISIVYPDNTAIEFTYNPVTRDLLSTKNVDLNITQSQIYNEFGQITSSTNAKNQTSIKTYDPVTGLLTKQTSANGSIVTYAYNVQGLLISKTTDAGTSTLTMTYEYDLKGNLVKVTDNAGKSVSYVYDLAGNSIQMISSTNGSDQQVTAYTYDEFNRIKSVKTPKGETTNYDYLATGELSLITDSQGNTTSFEYDNRGRLSKKISPDLTQYQFAYDANGNRTQEIDPNGNIKNYVYNEINKLTRVNLPDDIISYTYDLRGEVESAQNLVSVVAYQKDPKGRVTQVLTSGLGELNNFPVFMQDYTYDHVDNLTSMQSNYGSLFYSYDNANRLVALSDNSGDNFNFSYDSADRLTQIARPGGYTNFTYDNSGSVSALSHFSNSNALRSFANYEYDQRNFQTVKRTPAGDFNYGYDSNGQLKTANNPYGKNETFSYDPIGNRVTDDQGNYVYDQKLQKLQSDYQYNYFYDNNGNLIRKSPIDTTKTAYKYSYSSTNQLIKIEVVNGMLGQVIKMIEFKYDVLGRRMQKKMADVEAPTKSFTRRYIYSGPNIFAEFDGSNNMLAQYTHSPLRPDDVLSAQISSSGASAGLAQSSGKYFYLKDLLGSITDITDSSGNVIQKYEYSAYGKIYAIRDSAGNDVTSSPIVNTSFTYTGREWDAESGMYYYRARYYDASVGRFLQQDPDPGKLSLPSTFLSKYIYAGNNPVNFTDSTGRDFLGDVWKFIGDLILTTIAIVVTIIDFAIGTVLSWMGARKAPVLHTENDGWTLENSVFADMFGSASWGPAIFLRPGEEYGGEVWKHEYGHRLQYQEWGGWVYMGFMIERVAPSFTASSADPTRPNPKEMDADKRATDYFGAPICEYRHPTHPVPACRKSF